MRVNIGTLDRAARLILAALLAYAALGTTIFGAGLGVWLALIVAAVLAVTALAGRCPLYTMLGIRTCRMRP